MANQASLCVTFLIILNFSLVLGRNDYYQYFFSRFHKSSSTTVAPFSTLIPGTMVLPFSTLIPEVPPSYDAFSKPDSKESTDQDNSNVTVQHSFSSYDNDVRNDAQRLLVIRIVVIVGSIFFFIVLLCCLKFCCPGCCSTTRPGMVLRNNFPQQPIPTPRPELQQTVLQHRPPDQDMSQFPPPYQTLPAQQAYQLPSAQQQLQYSPMHQQDQYSPHQPQYPPPEMGYNSQQVPPPYNTKY